MVWIVVAPPGNPPSTPHAVLVAKTKGILPAENAPRKTCLELDLLLACLVARVDLLPCLLQNGLHFAGIRTRRRQFKILLVRIRTTLGQHNARSLRIDRRLLH